MKIKQLKKKIKLNELNFKKLKKNELASVKGGRRAAAWCFCLITVSNCLAAGYDDFQSY